MTTPRDIVLGSFIGDALALGPHWIYDPEEIRNRFGRVTNYQSPMATYHSGKEAGDFTHYGDQTMILLGSLAEQGRFDPESFAETWRASWSAPTNISYRDGATRSTLENLESGAAPDAAGSDSHDIAGAARIAPLFLLKWENDDDLLDAVRTEVSFTHRNPQVVEAAEYFVRVILAIRGGSSVGEALDHARDAVIWKALPDVWFDAAERSAAGSDSDAEALQAHGLACDIAVAFPSIIHLLRRYPQDPATSLIENASAGGDSAARGMILGMVHGAATPVLQWPPEWLVALTAREEIEGLISNMS
jgi:ADP-ribosylglycohydrolase